MKRTRRDSGAVLHWIVIATSLAVGAIVLSSETSIAPFHAEQKRLRSSDEALVLADSALALARAELERGAPLAALAPTPLGRLVRRIRARFRLPAKGAPLALVESKEL